jgi:lysozyme
MTINQAGLDLIKEFEGFRAEAYRDPVGVWTIGYGTTAAADVGIEPKAGMKISKADAEMYLSRAINKFAAQVDPKIRAPINENERAAFLSLAYNIGPGAFAKSSALRKFNEGDKAGAASAILLWNKAGGKVLAGLVLRREAEKALFLKPAKPPQEPPFHSKPSIPAETPQPRPTGLFAMLAGIFAAILGKKDRENETR